MQNDPNRFNNIGVVIIGRNEGERLTRCLKSLTTQSNQLVYVDSASTDDSVNMARSLGAEVVSLDMTMQFTAARARNEGFERMRKLYPQTEYVQFVDGDCEIAAGWLISAVNFLRIAIPNAVPAVVEECRRLKSEASWDLDPGPAIVSNRGQSYVRPARGSEVNSHETEQNTRSSSRTPEEVEPHHANPQTEPRRTQEVA